MCSFACSSFVFSFVSSSSSCLFGSSLSHFFQPSLLPLSFSLSCLFLTLHSPQPSFWSHPLCHPVLICSSFLSLSPVHLLISLTFHWWRAGACWSWEGVAVLWFLSLCLLCCHVGVSIGWIFAWWSSTLCTLLVFFTLPAGLSHTHTF